VHTPYKIKHALYLPSIVYYNCLGHAMH